MDAEQRSGCPINLTLEVVGDKWSLLVIRDMIFGNRRHFRELLNRSEEGIASNILADRLKRLVEQGVISKADDPTHKQKAIYSLTEKAIALLPIVVQIGAWGSRWVPDAMKLDAPARKFLRELVIEDDPRDAVGLLRRKEIGLAELVGEALAVLVDEDRAFLVEVG